MDTEAYKVDMTADRWEHLFKEYASMSGITVEELKEKIHIIQGTGGPLLITNHEGNPVLILHNDKHLDQAKEWFKNESH